MINFKTYLTESRSAPLYHATYINKAGIIIAQDILRTSQRSGNYDSRWMSEAISLTRSLKTAMSWISAASNITFELDQQKLAQNYKIKPVNMVHIWNADNPDRVKGLSAKHEELFEEFIDKPIKPLSKYLTKIIIFTDDLSNIPYVFQKHPLLYSYNKKKFLNK